MQFNSASSSMRDNLLQGQTALITGASSGINLSIAKRFAEQGANIVVLARNAEKLARACDEIGALNAGRVLGCSADVRDYAAVEAQVQRAIETFGALDIVIAGAAGNFLAPAAGMSANAFAAVIGIDLLGTFNTFRACFAHLRCPGARLLAISAPQAVNPTPMQSHACAAKAGIESLIRTLAVEWGNSRGVIVNGISPGCVADTEGMARLGGKLGDQYVAGLPVPRYTTVQEMAELALVLVSPIASYMTGQIVALDGGISLLGGGYTYSIGSRSHAQTA